MNHDDDPQSDEAERTVGQSAPWHFWVVVAGLVAYIGWRIIDLVLGLF